MSKTYEDVKQLIEQYDRNTEWVRLLEKMVEVAEKTGASMAPEHLEMVQPLYHLTDHYSSQQLRLTALAERLSALKKRDSDA